MREITKRRSVGWVPRFKQPIWMVAVLCNGVTIASFTSEAEADAYIAGRWPDRNGKQHDS